MTTVTAAPMRTKIRKVRDAALTYAIVRPPEAIAQVPVTGTPAEIGAARDAAVQEMLTTNPAVVNYPAPHGP